MSWKRLHTATYTLRLNYRKLIHNNASCSILITKNSRLLQIIAFYDSVYFVSVVSRQFISFVTKMEVVARIRDALFG